jgi:hypothetical protein
VHVQQQQTAQQEQAEAGDRSEPAAQMIGQSSQTSSAPMVPTA